MAWNPFQGHLMLNANPPAAPAPGVGAQFVLERDALQGLLDALAGAGFEVLGPTRRDEAIAYAPITRLDELPIGWTEQQQPGRSQLLRRADAALFGYAVGPQSWKRFLHPPLQTLWQVRQGADGMELDAPPPSPRPMAFFGVRACELRAIAVQDRVLRDGPFADPGYAARRRDCFIVAVNCAEAGGNCFCASMGSGPRAQAGFDLALTELLDDARHEFLVEVGSDAGARLLAGLDCGAAAAGHLEAAARQHARCAAGMGRSMPVEGLRELLQGNAEHPRWQQTADRCLSCGNCTMVCPTCFCTSVEDRSDLDGSKAQRLRRWDSCFTLDFSYIHGGSVRQSGAARYRQWITHKLANWFDQFASSGCVGCGRCITWCPVGIDITEEVAALRGALPDTPGASNESD
jgi:ferredoxin